MGRLSGRGTIEYKPGRLSSAGTDWEERRKKEREQQRKEYERYQRNQELYQKAVAQAEALKKESNRLPYKASRAVEKTYNVGKDFAKEMGKALGESAAFVGENLTVPGQLSRQVGTQKSALQAMADRKQGESAYDAYKRGLTEAQARPLLYEKLHGKFTGQKDYQLPELQGNKLQQFGQTYTNPEYRKAVTRAMEAPTWFGGAVWKGLEKAVGGKLGKNVLGRMAARTAGQIPDTLVNAGLQTAGEEHPTVKSFTRNILYTAAMMSAMHNVPAEVSRAIKKSDVDKGVKEIEKALGTKLEGEDLIDTEDLIKQGVDPKEVSKNIEKQKEVFSEQPKVEEPKVEPKKTVKEETKPKTEETTSQEALTGSEKPVDKSLEKKGVKVSKEKKESLETNTEPQKVAEKPNKNLTSNKAKKAEEDIKTNQKVSKVAKSIEQKMKDWGMIDKDSSVKKATYESRNVKDQTQKVAKIVSNEKELNAILNGEKELPKDTSASMFIAGVEDNIEKIKKTDPKKAFEMANKLQSSGLVGETGQHASELRLLQERNPDSVTARMQKVHKERIKKNKSKAKKAKSEIKKEINKVVKSQSWDDFIDSITC